MTARERIIELIAKMRAQTVDHGCTPAEAAAFAAKVAAWVEKYQIDEAELRAEPGVAGVEIEVCENILRTGKRVFNPGMTAVVNGLAVGMCCKVILLKDRDEAVYGITGDVLDVDYVCQLATSVVPALRLMANLEGVEHGHEKGRLIRWSNQYLVGAGEEIRRRLETERKDRSATKVAERAASTTCHALVLVTGETLAVEKRAAAEEAFRQKYPKTRKSYSRSEYDHTASQRGREAGKSIGLHIGIE